MIFSLPPVTVPFSRGRRVLKRGFQVCLGWTLFALVGLGSYAQEPSAPEPPRPLVLTEAIPMPGIQGRFDHFGFDGKNQLTVAALGNNSVEIIDISARVRSHSITGIPNPQGVVYAPEPKKLLAASSKGKLYIYDGTTFALIKSIDFHGDVDNLRYDAANHRVYVGYGEDETGAIGAVDAITNQRLAEEYKLGAHPESFQLETSGPNIYVNLPETDCRDQPQDASDHALAYDPRAQFSDGVGRSGPPALCRDARTAAPGSVRYQHRANNRGASLRARR